MGLKEVGLMRISVQWRTHCEHKNKTSDPALGKKFFNRRVTYQGLRDPAWCRVFTDLVVLCNTVTVKLLLMPHKRRYKTGTGSWRSWTERYLLVFFLLSYSFYIFTLPFIPCVSFLLSTFLFFIPNVFLVSSNFLSLCFTIHFLSTQRLLSFLITLYLST